MKLKKIAAALAACGLALGFSGAQAQKLSGDKIVIGFITDMSSLYSDIDGPGGVEAIRMAISDMEKQFPGKKIELVYADHQNKADIASSKVREWIDQSGADVIIGGTNSATALASAQVAAEKKRPYISIGAATSRLTNENCTPYTVHYAYDTVALANGTGSAVVKSGGKTWFFLTADYAFGHSLEKDTSDVVKAAGGTVVASVRAPLNASDFSSFLLQAQASKAKVIGLANAGGDTTNSIKQAGEFGIAKGGQRLAGLLVFLTEIHGLGLERAQGLTFTETFYWDMNEATRAFTKRFAAANGGKYPTMIHAGVYAGLLHYLKAVEAAKTDDGTKVVEQMKRLPTDDTLFGKGTIRADGRKVHPAYLFEAKKPSESKGPYDYYKLISTIPAEQAFRPMADGDCPLVAAAGAAKK